MQTAMLDKVDFSDGTWGVSFGVGIDTEMKVSLDLPKMDPMAQIEPRDFVYSEKQDLVGVVVAVDKKEGIVSIYLGNEVATFRNIDGRLVRTWWDIKGRTYSWETVTLLRDE